MIIINLKYDKNKLKISFSNIIFPQFVFYLLRNSGTFNLDLGQELELLLNAVCPEGSGAPLKSKKVHSTIKL